MKIYHVPGTRSIRIIWLCHELDQPLDIHTIEKFDAEFKTSSAWRQKSPTGKVPVLEDGDLTIFESGAMLDYILEKYGPGDLVPLAGTHESAFYHQWCWFAEATLCRPLGDIMQNRHIKAPADRIEAVIPDAIARARLCLDAVNTHIESRTYLLGEKFSAADIMMGYALRLAHVAEVFTSEHVHAKRYLGVLQDRPGCVYASNA